MRSLYIGAVIAAIAMILGFTASKPAPYPLGCDGHACVMSDGSYRLDPMECRRFRPETGEYK